MSIVSEFLNDRRQRVRLNGEVSASLDVVSGVFQGSVLGPLFILYTSELFHIVGNHILSLRDDTTTIYAVILRPLSYPQVME